MHPSDLSSLDATAQAELVRSREASPAELAEAAIERIEELNPQVNAVIHEFFEDGLAAAAGDLPDGPFKGVPFLLKDLGAAFAGQPYHLGTQLLKDIDFRCPVDTYLALRFRDAGFVTIGKTNLPELGILPTTEPGPTARPATRGISSIPRGDRAAGPPRRWLQAWSRSPMPTTVVAPSGFPPASVAWSA